MGKINILFDNTTYPIDESSLSTASAALQSHLSTVMNGAGATINFGGTSYSIDPTKLSTARNALISHLGTVAGNGYKVVVNGVEYNVDSAKMTSAVADLHDVLGGLQSGGNGGSTSGLNEYGFYFGAPYSAEFENEDGVAKAVFVLYEDGSGKSETYVDGVLVSSNEMQVGTFTYGDHEIVMNGATTFTVNADGTQLTLPDGMVLTIESSTPPTSSDGETVILEEQVIDGFNGGELYTTEFSFNFEENAIYRVVWDGVEYECPAFMATMGDSSGICVGNTGILGGDNTGEPFIIARVLSSPVIFFATGEATSATHTVAIYKVD